MKKAAIILIIIGLGLFLFTTFTFFTKEKVMKIGQIEITKDKPHHLTWSPLIGIAVIALGGIVLWNSTNKKQTD